MADDVRQHPYRPEHLDQRRLAPQLKQVDMEQGPPSGFPIGVGHGRDGVDTS